jgi:transcriptional regulator with XRE-family HTH domain
MRYMDVPEEVEPAAAISRLIGRRVRAGRTDLGWTLDQLAARSGVSRRMLINVEKGATNPSIATLLRLSESLGIGLPALVDTDEVGAPVVIHRDGQRPAMWTSPAGGAAIMVAGVTTPDIFELWDWRLGPGDSHRGDAHRAGTHELIHVLSGSVVLGVAGTEYQLRAGDSASFEATTPHSYGNPSDTRTARFSLAVYEPALAKEP